MTLTGLFSLPPSFPPSLPPFLSPQHIAHLPPQVSHARGLRGRGRHRVMGEHQGGSEHQHLQIALARHSLLPLFPPPYGPGRAAPPLLPPNSPRLGAQHLPLDVCLRSFLHLFDQRAGF
ncbi:hypothetical protein Naga_102672g1 [Nannochloropsis gaditana]|uniref:Uncharacterized protein n=1 Tax=Nannochloropsis gaditana TaxID=72520 RepID=W7T8B3_9STRA|nr:hypothetical protein Naga_102672g1 [Nannochloropsis gaditana]